MSKAETVSRQTGKGKGKKSQRPRAFIVIVIIIWIKEKEKERNPPILSLSFSKDTQLLFVPTLNTMALLKPNQRRKMTKFWD